MSRLKSLKAARFIGGLFVLGTALTLVLIATLAITGQGSIPGTVGRIFKGWLVVGFILAAAGLGLQGVSEARLELTRGHRGPAFVQVLLTVVFVAVALFLAFQAARW